MSSLAQKINDLLEDKIASPGDGSLLDRALTPSGSKPPTPSELAYLRVEILLAAWEEMHREAAAARAAA